MMNSLRQLNSGRRLSNSVSSKPKTPENVKGAWIEGQKVVVENDKITRFVTDHIAVGIRLRPGTP